MKKKPNQELRERFLKSERSTQPTSAVVGEMLGFIGRMAVETITADLSTLLSKGKHTEIDGYVFALSRIVAHDLAWGCISQAFASQNLTVPTRYAYLFGKQNTTHTPRPTLRAQ